MTLKLFIGQQAGARGMWWGGLCSRLWEALPAAGLLYNFLPPPPRDTVLLFLSLKKKKKKKGSKEGGREEEKKEKQVYE